jgi:small ligand-binding sensory domain FIST
MEIDELSHFLHETVQGRDAEQHFQASVRTENFTPEVQLSTKRLEQLEEDIHIVGSELCVRKTICMMISCYAQHIEEDVFSLSLPHVVGVNSYVCSNIDMFMDFVQSLCRSIVDTYNLQRSPGYHRIILNARSAISIIPVQHARKILQQRAST